MTNHSPAFKAWAMIQKLTETNMNNLQKKLHQAEMKLAAAMKLNSKKMALNAIFSIAKIEAKIDEKAKADVKPERRQNDNYKWNDNYDICTNLLNGKIYLVNDYACTCPSFKHKTGLIDNMCKHIRMRQELAPIKEKVYLDKNDLPAGTWVERSQDWLNTEFELYCYTKKFYNREFQIEQVRLGFISESAHNLFARTARGASKEFKSTKDAALYLVKYNGFIQSEIAELYGQKHGNVVSDELFWDKEEDLDIHVDESDRTPKKKWLSYEDLSEELVPF